MKLNVVIIYLLRYHLYCINNTVLAILTILLDCMFSYEIEFFSIENYFIVGKEVTFISGHLNVIIKFEL